MRVLSALILCTLMCSVYAQFSTCFTDVTSSNANSNAFDFSGVDRFGFALFRNLTSMLSSQQQRQGSSNKANMMLSPFSIWSVLTLALTGAKGGTYTELQTALGLPVSKLHAYRTKIVLDFLMKGSGLGANGGPELLSMDQAYFDPSMRLRDCVKKVSFKINTLDFRNAASAAARINDDVSRATGGEIRDLMDASSVANAVFVLVNAIYFKGSWKEAFKTDKTVNAPFSVPSSRGQFHSINVPTMTRQGTIKIAFSAAMGADVAELPYKNSNISMFIILPREESTTIEQSVSNLTPFSFEDVRRTMSPLPVSIALPKFDLKTKIESELVDSLKAMGIRSMFGNNANFLDFSNERGVFVDAAVHQANVRIDEEGTVAAAATGLVATRSGPSRYINFFVNKPFAFLIFDNRTKVTLFSGIVRNPTL